jgi:hypothetical protein
LIDRISEELREHHGASSVRIADAILERFDVTPKPVVTDDQLGRLVCFAHMGALPGSGGANYVRGGRMREVLEQHGLKIVRVEEVQS